MCGGVSENGCIPSHVVDRCHFVGANLRTNDYLIFSSLFSLNVPQKINKTGFVRSEAKSTYDYYSSIYTINSDRCFLENASFDTIGSVYFSFQMITSLSLDISEIVFVTSGFHYERVNFISQKISQMLGLNITIETKKPSIETYAQSDERERHEAEQLKALHKTLSSVKTPTEFCRWFYLEHDNYSTGFISERKSNDCLY